MNLLTDNLPTKIKVKDKIFDINSDYRTAINIMQAYEDEELTLSEKNYIMVYNLYKDEIPEEYYLEASKKACEFLDKPVITQNKDTSSKRVYSFSQDGNYIFSGINSTHKIDLSEKTNLHWWKFMALFMDMDTECFFSELVYYRMRKNKGKLTKEEKKTYQDMKYLIELEENEIKEVSKSKEAFLKEFYS